METKALRMAVVVGLAALLALSALSQNAAASGAPPSPGNNTSPADATEKLEQTVGLNQSNADLGKSVGAFFKSVGGALGSAGSAIGKFLDSAAKAIGGAALAFGKGFVAVISIIGGALGAVFSAIGSAIAAVFLWIGKALPAAGAAVWNGIVFLFGAIGSGIVYLIGAVGMLFAGIGKLLSDLAALIWSLKPKGMTDVEYGATIAAVTCGASGASFGIWYWIKKLAPGGAALFTRIPQDKILENPTRRQIFNAIQRNPGINMSQISKRLGIGWGTTVHHVKKLEAAMKVHVEDRNNERCFFENGGEFPVDSMAAAAALKDSTAKGIFGYIRKKPGASQKDVAAHFGIRPSLVSWHVTRLEKEGIINRNRSGKSFQLTINEKFNSLKLRDVAAV
ncbi:MAG: hypothetical protein CVT47_00660 [Thermoplasmata archaeon HGW-Thermoplasmata-2]|nr:MAG: hypothetical protein CVT47_00660 [Thermoplasmata archaeon HGW-Thermoplasmata-2]